MGLRIDAFTADMLKSLWVIGSVSVKLKTSVSEKRESSEMLVFNSTLTRLITREDFTTSVGVFVVENMHCKFESFPFSPLLQICSLYLIRLVFQFGPCRLFADQAYQHCSKLLLLLFSLFVFVISKPYVTA
jgi:hypothetical protein